MAQVPAPYEPNKIVSPAVGTPGVDNSGQKIGQSIAGNLTDINQVQYERQKLIDQIGSKNAVNDVDNQLVSLRNNINKSFYDKKDDNGNPIIVPPDQQRDEFLKQAKPIIDARAKTLPTIGQRNDFALSAAELLKTHQDAAFKEGMERQTNQSHASMLSGLLQNAQANSDVWANPDTTKAQKFDDMNRLLDQANGMAALYRKVLPAKDVETMVLNWGKQFSTGAINGAIQNDPNLAQELLDSRVFENHLTPLEEESLSRKTAQAIERKDKEVKQNIAYSKSVVTQNLYQGISKGTTRLQDIDQAYDNGDIKQPEHKALTDLLVSPKMIDKSEKDEVYNNLVEEQNKLFTGKNTTKEATLENVSLLRQHVMEAERMGAISQSKAQTFFKAVTPVIDDKALETIKDSMDNRRAGTGFFGMWADHYIKTEPDQQKAKAELSHQLLKQIDDAEANGQTLTPADVKNMSQEILKGYITKNYPESINAKDTPNSLITQAGGPTQLHGMPTESGGGQKVSQTKSQFKPGDEQDKDGQTWIRGTDGKWRPKSKP